MPLKIFEWTNEKRDEKFPFGEPKFKYGEKVVLRKERKYGYNNKYEKITMTIKGTAPRRHDVENWYHMVESTGFRFREGDLRKVCKLARKRRR